VEDGLQPGWGIGGWRPPAWTDGHRRGGFEPPSGPPDRSACKPALPWPVLVAQGRTVQETLEIARDVARRLKESGAGMAERLSPDPGSSLGWG